MSISGAEGARGHPASSVRWPALDGVRAIAIALVVAFHLGHLAAGWIGVDVFFVLSGFLITTLLLGEHQRHGRIDLPSFWARRAKRLLPAVLLLLLVLATYAWAGGPGVIGAQLRAPSLATLFYVANWQQLAASHNYFAQFSAPDPLTHTWSLAIEEQYYLVWPILAAAILVVGQRVVAQRSARRDRPAPPLPTGRTRTWMFGVTVSLGLASAVWMGVVAHLWGVNRAYLGTDTRAWELLLGAFGALAWGPNRLGGSAAGGNREIRPRLWSIATGIGALGLGTMVVLAGASTAGALPPMWVWDGGLAAGASGTLLVIVGVVRSPDSSVARLLACPPLRWLGVVSYSLYLWHWPVIVLMNGSTTGLSGAPLLASRVAAMLALTCASYYMVEGPLRRADWSVWWRRSLVPIGVGATATVIVAATVVPSVAGTGALAASKASSAAASPASPASPAGPAAGAAHPIVDPLPAGRVVSTSDPLRVWIFGDSVMRDSSPGVTAALEATGDAQVVANSSFGGWGLSTDRGWPGDAQSLVAQDRPEVAIGTWSWDDGSVAADPSGYANVLRGDLSALLAPANGIDLVVLLEFPQTGPDPDVTDPVARQAAWVTDTAQQRQWDRTAALVAQDFPGRVLFLPTSQLFAPGGRFLTWMRTASGGWVRARKLDNVHVCPYGAALFGQLVATDLQPVLGLGPMKPGWQAGSWVTDPLYNDPPGACPADQPPARYRGIVIPGALAQPGGAHRVRR